jgi:orotidine-5'-phosphate decarboxylase
MDQSPPKTTLTANEHLAGARDRLIVALDYPNPAAAIELVDRLENRCTWFKVGLELYLGAGPSLVESLRKRGYHVFVDLKLHDIPNTVAGAVRTLSSAGANLLSIHAAGGRPMMVAAVEAAERIVDGPEIVAVTVLTSLDSRLLSQTGVAESPAAHALHLAKLAHGAGCAGMVCSAHEASILRTYLGRYRLLVVPGIRPAGFPDGDQSRTATPSAAIADGASLLVVGRPITRAEDPAQAADAILREIERALERHEP